MYRRLDGSATTVHQLSYPSPDERRQDEALERRMATLRRVEEAAATARQQAGRKLRWPVSRVIVESADEATRAEVKALADLLADRTNARSVEVVGSFDELVEYAAPEMSAIGPAFGADAQAVMNGVEGSRLADLQDARGELVVEVDGEQYELTDEMVAVQTEPPEDVSGAAFADGMVYVDAGLTEALESEGYARDVVRRIQEMRKRLDLDVEEEIEVALDVADGRIAGFVDDHREFIATETRTNAWAAHEDREFDLVEEWEVEGVNVTIAVARTESAEQAV
jgi:isoleucyl-tRNA synthetase